MSLILEAALLATEYAMALIVRAYPEFDIYERALGIAQSRTNRGLFGLKVMLHWRSGFSQ